MEESVSLTSLSLNHCVRARSTLIGVETAPGTKAMGLPATEHSKVSAEASPMRCPCILRSPYVVLIPCNNLTGRQRMYLRAARPAHPNAAKLWCPQRGFSGSAVILGMLIYSSQRQNSGVTCYYLSLQLFFFFFNFHLKIYFLWEWTDWNSFVPGKEGEFLINSPR